MAAFPGKTPTRRVMLARVIGHSAHLTLGLTSTQAQTAHEVEDETPGEGFGLTVEELVGGVALLAISGT